MTTRRNERGERIPQFQTLGEVAAHIIATTPQAPRRIQCLGCWSWSVDRETWTCRRCSATYPEAARILV